MKNLEKALKIDLILKMAWGGPMALLALLALEIWKIWVQSAKSAKSAKKFFNQNRVYLRKFRKNQFSKLAFIRSEIC